MEEIEVNIRKLDDESLITKIDEHRQLVLSILYDRYEKRIYFKAISILKNKPEAMDLAHDIFITIFTSINKFEGKSKFSLWVHSISFNTCVKYLNSKKKIQLFPLDDINEEVIDTTAEDVSEKELLEINLEALESFLVNLKEEERMLILMKYMDGLTVREMSSITELKESTIKMKLMRTRQKLLKMYHQNLEMV